MSERKKALKDAIKKLDEKAAELRREIPAVTSKQGVDRLMEELRARIVEAQLQGLVLAQTELQKMHDEEEP